LISVIDEHSFRIDDEYVKVGRSEVFGADEPNLMLRSCRNLVPLFCLLDEIAAYESIKWFLRAMRSLGDLSVQRSSVGGPQY
jgi:hypothetical protein